MNTPIKSIDMINDIEMRENVFNQEIHDNEKNNKSDNNKSDNNKSNKRNKNDPLKTNLLDLNMDIWSLLLIWLNTCFKSNFIMCLSSLIKVCTNTRKVIDYYYPTGLYTFFNNQIEESFITKLKKDFLKR